MSTQPPADLTQHAHRLRSSTCELLALGAFDTLPAADKVLVDRVAALRLQVDDFRVRQLRGEALPEEFVAASEALERTLRQRLTPEGKPNNKSLEEARAKVEKFIDARIEHGIKAGLKIALAENARLEAELAALKESPPADDAKPAPVEQTKKPEPPRNVVRLAERPPPPQKPNPPGIAYVRPDASISPTPIAGSASVCCPSVGDIERFNR
jgi:hypothetical protein